MNEREAGGTVESLAAKCVNKIHSVLPFGRFIDLMCHIDIFCEYDILFIIAMSERLKLKNRLRPCVCMLSFFSPICRRSS